MTSPTTPLAGLRVLVPRSPGRGDGPDPTAIAIAAAGAEPVPVELISTVLPEDPTDLDDLLLALGMGYYTWVALTSAAALPALVDRAEDAGTDLAALTAGTHVAAVGKATARALRSVGVEVDLVPPTTSSAAALLAAWPALPAEGGRVLLPHGDLATPTLVDGLRARGWEVDPVVAYRTVPGPGPDADVSAAYARGDLAGVLLTSGSTARNLVAALGLPPSGTLVCCIGESTAEVARSIGLRVAAVATEQTPAGLVAALVSALPGNGPAPVRPPFHPIRR